jgi:hypothetical protein
MCASTERSSHHSTSTSVASDRSVSADEAIALARGPTGVSETVAASASLVRRVDRPGSGYYLVVFSNDTGALAVATVDAATSEIGTMARLPGRSPHLRIDAAKARALANAPEESGAELVWAPGNASRSPLYPVWQIDGPSGRVYVTHRGEVVTQLQ